MWKEPLSYFTYTIAEQHTPLPRAAGAFNYFIAFPRLASMPLTLLTPSVILSGAKIPICHPQVQRRILIGIFAKSKFCGVQLQCNETKQNRRRRDLRWLYETSAQPLLHFFVDCRERLSLHYVLCAGSVSETCADPAARLSRLRFCVASLSLRSAKLRLGRSLCDLHSLRMTLGGGGTPHP